jgi:hypothetical protein
MALLLASKVAAKAMVLKIVFKGFSQECYFDI